MGASINYRAEDIMGSHAEPITDPTEAQRKLWDLIKDIRFAMFSTRHGDGHLHSRPMTTQNSRLDEDANLWFFMARASDAVAWKNRLRSIGFSLPDSCHPNSAASPLIWVDGGLRPVMRY